MLHIAPHARYTLCTLRVAGTSTDGEIASTFNGQAQQASTLTLMHPYR